MGKRVFTIIWILTVGLSYREIKAQSVSGTFPKDAGQNIYLGVYQGFSSYTVLMKRIGASGSFNLPYNKVDHGIGFIYTDQSESFTVILNGENVVLSGETLQKLADIKVVAGKENQVYEKYSAVYNVNEKALNAWIYLKDLYAKEKELSKDQKAVKSIQTQIEELNKLNQKTLEELKPEPYTSWYIDFRSFIGTLQNAVQYQKERIPELLNKFRSVDYAGSQLYSSGLFSDAIYGHFWLIQNSGLERDTMIHEMKKSVDYLFSNLANNPNRLSEVMGSLFNYLEQQQMFELAEYIALSVLDGENCSVDEDIAVRLDSYRAMQVGNVVGDFVFPQMTNFGVLKPVKYFSEIDADYTVLVFASSWCEYCAEELPVILGNYSLWKSKNVEVVLFSLDEDEKEFQKFVKDFPFVCTTDLKKWESDYVKQFRVYGTPTIYVISKNMEIVLRPKHVSQINDWLKNIK